MNMEIFLIKILKNNFVKLELGIGKGKKLYDKREDMAKKDAERKIERILKNVEY